MALTWGHYKVLLQRPDGAGFICRFSALIPGEIAFFGGSAATSACNVSATKFTFSIAFSEALTYNKNVIRQSWEKEIFEFWDFHETVHNETQNESIKHNNL